MAVKPTTIDHKLIRLEWLEVDIRNSLDVVIGKERRAQWICQCGEVGIPMRDLPGNPAEDIARGAWAFHAVKIEY